MSYYHAKGIATVLHGDCLNELRTIPDNSIDAVVTDPPYGLSNTTPAQVADTITRWVQGERDSVAWAYGCLSDDTEIPTSEGWVRYNRAKEGQHALPFDTATGELAWQAIRHVHRYPHAGEMVRLHSEHTDQLLTPNHRVVLDEGRSTPHTPYVPSDQDLRRLLADVPGARPLPVGAEADVLAGVRGAADLTAEEGQDQASRRAGGPHGAVRDLRDGDVEAGRMAQADHGGVLFEPVQRVAQIGGVGEALPQGQGGLDRHQPGVLPGEDDRAEQPRLEGRRDVWPPQGELHRPQVREVPGGMADDGPEGRVHHGASPGHGPVDRQAAGSDGSGESHQPRPSGQSAGEPGAVPVERGSQAWRGWPVCSRCGKPSIPDGLGTVLDPFAGSGTTLEAAVRERVQSIGIEREDDYLPLIKQRLERAVAVKDELTGFAAPPPKPKTDDQTALF